MLVIADTFARWCDDGLPGSVEPLGRKPVAGAAGVTTKTVGEWINGNSEPDREHVERMVDRRSALPEALQQELLDWHLQHSRFRARPVDAPTLAELDPNGDGRVDAADEDLITMRLLCATAEKTKQRMEADDARVDAALDEMERQLRLVRAAREHRRRQHGVRLAR